MMLDQLGFKMEPDFTRQTMKNAIDIMNYYKFIIFKNSWINKKIAKDWIKLTNVIPKRYLQQVD